MRMVQGDVNVYWYHDTLTPHNVRAASYGNDHCSGTLLPDEGDVINGFHGYYGVPITVRVVSVKSIGVGCVAYEVRVTDV